jgi:hypothetical protein
LAANCFSSKTFDFGGWICFDFLGFSRPNRYFSMGYAEKTRKTFIGGLGRSKRQRAEETMRTARIVHGESVIKFLVLRKTLSSEVIAVF